MGLYGQGPKGGGWAELSCPWQDDGELCLNSAQCNSKCCHRENGLSLARALQGQRQQRVLRFVEAGGAGCRGRRRRLRGVQLSEGRASRLGCGPQGRGSVLDTGMLKVKGRSAHFKALFEIPSTLLSLTSDRTWAGQAEVLSLFHGWVNRGLSKHC